MRACGWDVIDVEDGCYDVQRLITALSHARSSIEKPTFINVRTIIGIGSKVAGDAKAHGAAFGPDNVAEIKKKFGMNPDEHFVVSDEVYDFFSDAKGRGQTLEENWKKLLVQYSEQYPELYEEFKLRVEGKMTDDWTQILPSKEEFPTTPTPSRKSAGLCCNPLAAKLQNLMVGTADLTPSVNMAWKGKLDFQNVSVLRKKPPSTMGSSEISNNFLRYSSPVLKLLVALMETILVVISTGVSVNTPWPPSRMG